MNSGAGDKTAPPPATSNSPTPRKRDAFSELMSSNQKKSKTEGPKTRAIGPYNPADPRNGLLPYVLNPASYPPSVVIRHTEHSVLIHDAFPKATVHVLLLPRDPAKYNLHPHEAFADEAFLDLIRAEAATAVQVATSELSRLISPSSRTCQSRIEAMESCDPPATLLPGRDFSQELRVGIHAHPSMNHLHIHIFSRDMHSDRLKHRKHYNSFNTEFFIPLADYPLSADDIRRKVSFQNDNLRRDFKCWRCGRMFGNKFKELKEHLEVEFEEWKKE